MPDMPLASVIIPTRDCIAWLPGAILSIGPNPDIEIIVFNDGSTDGTREWLAEAARADRRIVVMEGTGIGPSKARNAAIEAARAPLLAFLDADDRWYPGKLEQQIALHRRFPEASFSFTDYRHVTGDGEDRADHLERRHVGAAAVGNSVSHLQDVGVGGEQVLFSVIIEIDNPHAPRG